MTKKKKKKPRHPSYLQESQFDFDIDSEDFDDFTDEELIEYEGLMHDFPELDELDGILDYDDEDFYTKRGE